MPRTYPGSAEPNAPHLSPTGTLLQSVRDALHRALMHLRPSTENIPGASRQVVLALSGLKELRQGAGKQANDTHEEAQRDGRAHG